MAPPYSVRKVTTVVTTADTTLKATAGDIYWITVSNSHATDSAQVELDNGGTDVWGVEVEARDVNGAAQHFIFDPPIHCDTSIIIDITAGTVKATVAFA